MPSAALPRAQSAIADQSGRPTREWYTYFLELRDSAGLTPAQQQQLDDLAARVEALEGNGGSGGTIQGVGSIITYGAPPGIIQITLEGDSDAPGNTWYYGTGPDGTRAWYSLADGFSVTADLTKAVDGTTGVTTYGLADLANSGAGALLAITRDAKGRVLGTRSATITGTTGQIDVANGTAAAGLPTISLADLANSGTGTAIYKTTRDAKGRTSGQVAAVTDDLPESGSPTNQWFTNARADARIALQKGQPNGLATLGADGKVPASQLNIPRKVPAYLRAGTASPIPLNSDNTVPAKLRNGNASNIPVQV
ncbi:hypothetical protein [Pseudoxanthomonas sp. USHLN014]|uniref:hypothetical protein n=1 Tax=Pseudoxanthomonas sp. USHLN014 TaxID=3081297 RepID=UPI00301CC953